MSGYREAELLTMNAADLASCNRQTVRVWIQNTKKVTGKGTGMGLAIVHGRVKTKKNVNSHVNSHGIYRIRMKTLARKNIATLMRKVLDEGTPIEKTNPSLIFEKITTHIPFSNYESL